MKFCESYAGIFDAKTAEEQRTAEATRGFLVHAKALRRKGYAEIFDAKTAKVQRTAEAATRRFSLRISDLSLPLRPTLDWKSFAPLRLSVNGEALNEVKYY